MGKKSAPDIPEPVDVLEMIETQAAYNRTGQNNLFGSTTWTGDKENGFVQEQTLHPAIEAAFDRIVAQSGNDEPGYQRPQQMDAMLGALMNRRERGYDTADTYGKQGTGTLNPSQAPQQAPGFAGGQPAPQQQMGGAPTTSQAQEQLPPEIAAPPPEAGMPDTSAPSPSTPPPVTPEPSMQTQGPILDPESAGGRLAAALASQYGPQQGAGQAPGGPRFGGGQAMGMGGNAQAGLNRALDGLRGNAMGMQGLQSSAMNGRGMTR